MIPYFHCLWKYGQTRGLWMQLVVEILVRWSIRPSICRRVIVCSTTVLFMAQIISVSSSPSSTLWPFAGTKACTIKLSTPTLTTPSSGFRSANVRLSWSVIPRQNSSSRSSPEPKTGSRPTTTAIPSSNGRRRSGVKSPPTSAENKNYRRKVIILFPS